MLFLPEHRSLNPQAWPGGFFGVMCAATRASTAGRGVARCTTSVGSSLPASGWTRFGGPNGLAGLASAAPQSASQRHADMRMTVPMRRSRLCAGAGGRRHRPRGCGRWMPAPPARSCSVAATARTDLPPSSRTGVNESESAQSENGGHKEEQVQRRAGHRFPEPSHGRDAGEGSALEHYPDLHISSWTRHRSAGSERALTDAKMALRASSCWFNALRPRAQA